MDKVLVTGASGHIGNVLVRSLLDKNIKVSALVLPNEDLAPLQGLNVQIIYGDITDREVMFKIIEKDMIVYHLAGIIDIGTIPHAKVYSVNVDGTKNIVDACMQNGAKKLVYLSTVHIIDPKNMGDELKEPTEFNPKTIVGSYAKTKVEATNYIFNACKQGLNATVLYPSGILGPFDFKISELGQVILDYLNHKLLVYIKGGYNFVDVRDVVEATINASHLEKTGEGYILSGVTTSLKEMFEMINKKTGRKKLPPKIALWFVRMFAGLSNLYYKVRNKKPVFSKYSLYTLNSNSNFINDKAKRDLAFNPRPPQESINDSIDWFIKNKPELVKIKKQP